MSSQRRNSGFKKADDRGLPIELKNQIVGLIKEVLSEADSPIVRNVTAKEKFDDFIKKPENAGEKFTKEEFDISDSLDDRPYKKDPSALRYSAIEPTNGHNKELVIIKKQNRYIAFFSAMKPVDVSSDQEIPDETKNPGAGKDDIFIKISRPFKTPGQDTSLLSNFINVLTKEYQI